MEKQNIDLAELLEYIDPGALEYQDWINVGMALKHEGYSVDVFDSWSRRDVPRYHPGECQKKWATFNGASGGAPVTAGTIVDMAKAGGWVPAYSHELDWDDDIGGKSDELTVVNKDWIESKEITIPDKLDPVKEITEYLQTLFESTENVGYVTECWENSDGKFLPTKGAYDRSAGELIKALSDCGGDIGSVIGDYRKEAGAWIRFNPLDGKGVKNENVTDFRYALVESDSMDIAMQNAIIRELELPVAVMVYSGGKSLHAIVRIEAANYDEYRKRVDYLYDVCKKNGLKIDSQNRNPSRLSRLPGVYRGNQKQFIVAKNIGKESYAEWKEWIEGINDDLPDTENFGDMWDNLPQLSPELISGVLRQGHKMLVTGPSKAGKTFALMELCVSIAEGTSWLGFKCAKGKVLFVNLEVDRASCLHRFHDVYRCTGTQPNNLHNIDIWNLRGRSVPMDKLAPKLIRRAAKKNYTAIIVDPIYKVITGDENSADQMAHFCNQFDKVCTELGCAVIYCHHHSKGGQGGKKSMDRASGAGVFARDPDALVDLTELELNENIIKQVKNNAVASLCSSYLKSKGFGNEFTLDDECSRHVMVEKCKKLLPEGDYDEIGVMIENTEKATDRMSAWRIEGTLREFPKFAPINLWFDYPVHRIDDTGVLKDITPEDTNSKGSPWKQNFKSKKTPEQKKQEANAALVTAFSAVAIDGKCTIKDLAEYLGKSEKTVRRNLKENENFWVDDGDCGFR